LLVNKERQKLSKRQPGVDMSWYKDRNVFPPALLNFAVLLGWHQGKAKDVMTVQDMIDNVSPPSATSRSCSSS
jgi:glutamyl/glutaminyl-tRNA synthetase